MVNENKSHWKPMENIEIKDLETGFDTYYPFLAFFTILVYLLFGFLSMMITLYERFGMDTQKRGLKNRLVSSLAEFGIIFSIASIGQEFYMVCFNRNPSSTMIYGFFWLVTGVGLVLNINEIIMWEYLVKTVYKRVPEFNHDLLGVWLEISNIFIAFMLAMVQAHSVNFAKRHKYTHLLPEEIPYHPDIRVFIPIVGFMYLQSLIVFGHSVINFIKTKNSTPVYVINLPSIQNLQINNTAYNPDLANIKQISFFVSITIVPLAMYGFGVQKLVTQLIAKIFNQSFVDIESFFHFSFRLWYALFVSVIPTVFFLKNRKLRAFSWKFISCRFEDL